MADHQTEPVAIIGMACRFPGGAVSPSQFWNLLHTAQDAIIDVPADRWNKDLFYHPDPEQPGKMYVRQGGFLQQPLGWFDAPFFNITPREAEQLDPQQRLLLEVTYEAFEDAGLTETQWSGSNTGVYVGAFTMDHMGQQLSYYNRSHIMSHTGMSTTMVMLSNRISYMFDLHGPSMTVDTACSSSMVALHLACTALRNGECDLALAGGVNMMFRPEFVIAMSKGRFLSRQMRSKTFDATADGYVRGEGAGLLVLKPLSLALRDHDQIHAVITATGVNQDGRTEGITLPNQHSQFQLMQQVWQQANIHPDDIGYFEAHGTGTQAGDVTEALSIGQMLAGREQPCPVGSVKTNIGHLEAAAGVAGIIKAVLCLQHETIPPHLHLTEVNPGIDLEKLHLHIPQTPEKLHSPFIAVNSFGYGGTNAHALLTKVPTVPAAPPAPSRSDLRVFPFSAQSEASLRTMAERHATFLTDDISLDDYGYTLTHHRQAFDHRLAITARSSADLREALSAFARQEPLKTTAYGKVLKTAAPDVAFVYTGMGAQSIGMGRTLLHDEPVFRAAFEEVDALFQQYTGWSLRPLFEGENGKPITSPAEAQPANFALQIALTALWKSLGIVPAAFVGHSVGEIAAAAAAGTLALEEAVRLTVYRSQLQQRVLHQGGMLAVGISAEDAHAFLNDRVSLAAVNSATSVVLAGDLAELDTIAARLESDGIFQRRLLVDVAYHSYQMDELETDFKRLLGDLRSTASSQKVYSSVTGSRLQEAQNVHYWWQNCRQPVQFAQAVQNMIADGIRYFVEIGPHPVLAAALRETLQATETIGVTVASLRRGEPEQEQIRLSIATLTCVGAAVDWRAQYPQGSRLTLPVYAWDHGDYWSEPDAVKQDRIGIPQHPLLQFREVSAKRGWQSDLTLTWLDYLRDHRIEDQPIFPASGYIETALAWLGLNQFRDGNTLQHLEFVRLLNLNHSTVLQLHHNNDGELTFHSRTATDPAAWTLHARGRSIAQVIPPREAALDLDDIRQRLTPYEQNPYSLLAERGLHYGERFCLMDAVFADDGEFLARLQVPADYEQYHWHPAVMDAGFQAFILTFDARHSASMLYLPTSVREIRYHHPATTSVWCYGHIQHARRDWFEGDLTFTDADGQVLLEIFGLRAQSQPLAAQPHTSLNDLLYRIGTEPLPEPESADLTGEWLVFADSAAWMQSLSQLTLASPVITSADVYSAADPQQHLQQLLQPLRHNAAGLIYLWSAENAACTSEYDEAEAGIAQGIHLLDMIQTIIRMNIPHGKKLIIVTAGSQATDAVPAVEHPALMVTWGLGRVFANEHPEMQVSLIDLDPEQIADSLRMLPALLGTPLQEPEIIIRDGQMYVNRFMRYQEPAPEAHIVAADIPLELRITHPGVLDSLHFQETIRQAPAPDEVEVRVYASGLNFKDVMKALHLLPASYLEATYFKDTLGLEFAGEVVRVGVDVSEYQAGDRVVGMSPLGSFRTYTTASTRHITRIPAHFRYEDSVIFTNFVTAWYGLHEVARLQAGETVLIHSASGGVGLAAIQIARWSGAHVIATAGSESKRAYLRSIGIEHVSDSRSLRFVDDVRRWTNNSGVDVVLNSLSSEALHQSLQLLAPFGRFIELGKIDITENRKLALLAFDRNLMFAAVDIDLMAQQRPDKLHTLLQTISGLFAQHALEALPVEIYAAEAVSAAFRQMSQSRHIGKIVIQLPTEPIMAYPDPQQSGISSGRTWLITGGYRGLGLETARWLVQHGVRHLVLTSRSGASNPAAQAALAEFAAQGVEVLAAQTDIANQEDVRLLMQQIRSTFPPLGGIVHSAMVLDDALLAEMTPERLITVLAPKVRGAWILHQESMHDDLDAFILFSSISAVIGNPRQGNYVAANSFLDGLAHYRRSRGLPAISINLGPLSEVGVVARNPKVEQYLANMGLAGLSPAVVFDVFDQLLRSAPPQISLVDVRWQQWLNSSMVGADSPRYQQLTRTVRVQSSSASPLINTILAAPAEERPMLVAAFLLEQIARVTRIPLTQLDASLAFDQLGLDSLMVLELNNLVRAESGHDFSVVMLSQSPSIAQMAEYLLEMIRSRWLASE